MRPDEVPFDLSYTFDADLREVPVDSESMAMAIEWLRDRLKADSDQPGIHSLLGVYCRIVRRESEAEAHLLEALRCFDATSPSAFVARLRLAHVYQWQRRFPEAERLFLTLLRESETRVELRRYFDFACQHFGKCLFDQAAFDKAADYFRRALAARRERGATEDLLASSEIALAEALRRQRDLT